MTVAKYILVSAIALLSKISFAQKLLPATVHHTSLHAQAIVANLPKPVKEKTTLKKAANEENEEEEKGLKRKKRKDADINTFIPATQSTEKHFAKSTSFELPCANLRGLTQGGNIPPDVTTAIGFDHIMIADNDSFRIMDKNGNVLRQELEGSASGFWSVIDNTALFDPKLVYDPLSKRWVFVIATDSRTASSAFLVAVSQTPDPMGNWFFYRIDADSENDQWFDYPSVGFNGNWIVITGNMFQNPGYTLTTISRAFVFNKNQAYTGSSLQYSSFDINGYTTLSPAATYDANQTDLWCVTNDDFNDNDLRYFKVSGLPGIPYMTEEGFVSIGSDWAKSGGDLGPQSGTANKLNTGDHDILSVIWRNGKLYSVQTTFFPSGFNPTTCTIQMVIADPASTTVFEAVRFISDNNTMYAFPWIAVNINNDIVISCAKFTNTSFPSACVLVRRNGSTTFTESIIRAGQDWYYQPDSGNPVRNRWGDYYGAMVDPSDDNSIWVAGEYSLPRIPASNGIWASWLSKICSGACQSDVYVNTIQVNGTLKKYEAANTIFANSKIDAGAFIKLDAGIKIVLQNGFKATDGSRVKIFIEGCSGVE